MVAILVEKLSNMFMHNIYINMDVCMHIYISNCIYQNHDLESLILFAAFWGLIK